AQVRQAAPHEQYLVRHLRRRYATDLLGRQLPERAVHVADRLVPRRIGARAALLLRGSEAPFGRVHEAEPVASGVADPPLVDLRVEARLEPGDAAPLGVMRAAPVHVDLDVAAARAARADRLGGVEVPDTHL